jgi:hypothetical protein
MKEKKKWDVFISHASEDKESFVKELATNLGSFGLKVWYDDFSLKVGDSINQSINNGIANSNYGIIVLSNVFFEKYWPQNEANGLFIMESINRNTILPIWHNIDKQGITKYSPILADKKALLSSENMMKISLEIIKIVNPVLAKSIHARLVYNQIAKNGQPRTVDINTLKKSPIIHDKLKDSQIRRLRLIKAIFDEEDHISMEAFVSDFKRDLYPDDEINKWENMAIAYLETINRFRLQKNDEKKELFKAILLFYTGQNILELNNNFKFINEEQLNFITESYDYKYPIWDFIYDEDLDFYF